MSRERADRCDGFELDPRKFMNDTRGWTAEQVGVYFRLLCEGWLALERPGHFPDDLAALRSFAVGSTDAEWERAQDRILGAMKHRGGCLVQDGQAREYDRQTRSVAASKARGRFAGLKSAAKRSDLFATTKPTDVQHVFNGRSTDVPTDVQPP